MSDWFYSMIVCGGCSAFWVSSTPLVIGAQHTRRKGAFILAANHESPYDVALLMRHSERRLDFLSIVEVFRDPFVRWLYTNMNAMPLDRSRPDAATVRTVLDRLSRGRAVAMFPEGGFRVGEQSVIHTRRIRPGIGRISSLSGAPIVPSVIIGSAAYSNFRSWLPTKQTRYGIIFGPPLEPRGEPADIERRLVDRLVELHGTLAAAMRPRSRTIRQR